MHPTDQYGEGVSKPAFMALGSQQLVLKSAGQTVTKIQLALANSQIRIALSQFSPELQRQIGALSDAQVRVIKGGISGTTEIGPMTVDNRKAFIKGSVAFKSIWGNVHQNISDARCKYAMINEREEKGLHTLIDTVSGLDSDQRRRLAEMLDQIP